MAKHNYRQAYNLLQEFIELKRKDASTEEVQEWINKIEEYLERSKNV